MLLPWLILIPFIGGLLCWQLERFGTKVPRWIALIAMGLTLALSLQLWMQGGYTLTTPKGIPQWQSEFLLPWIPRFGISIVENGLLHDDVHPDPCRVAASAL